MVVVTGTVLGLAILFGAPLVEVALLAIAALEPLVAAGLVVLLTVGFGRRRVVDATASHQAVVLAAIASELRTGATLSRAVIDAASRAPDLPLGAAVRLGGHRSGSEAFAVAVGDVLGNGDRQLVAAAVRLATDQGGRAADVFERLALRRQRRVELDAEVDAATAQALLSVKVLVALPVLLMAGLMATDGLAPLLASGTAGRLAVAVGAALQAAGVASVLLQTRRALR